MNRYLIGTCIALSLTALSGTASAKGCITGAAVGGVAGHVAGHHGLIGAAAGCAVNHHRNKVKDEKAAATSNQAQVAPAAPAPAAPVPRQ